MNTKNAVKKTQKKKRTTMTPFEMAVFAQLDQGRTSAQIIARHLGIPTEYVSRAINAMSKEKWLTNTGLFVCGVCKNQFDEDEYTAAVRDSHAACAHCGACLDCGEVHDAVVESGMVN
jgi:hypothetical protein